MNKQNEPTKKELENIIREYTKTAKAKYKDFISSGDKLTGAVKTEIESLRNIGILSEHGNIVSNLRGKSKEFLQRQIDELEYFNQWQGMETRAVRDKTNYAKYQDFKRWHPEGSTETPFSDYTYQQWRNMVELMGTQSSLLESFGFDSNSLQELYDDMKTQNKQITDDKLIGLMESIKGRGLTKTNAVDLLRSTIGLTNE